MSASRSRPWWLAAALGAALVAGAVSLWALRGGATDADVGAQRGESAESSGPTEGGAAGAPSFPALDERAPLVSETAVGAESAALAETASLSAVASWTGATSTFTGVVVDHEGRPVVGATVTCWPNADTREALGIDEDAIGSEIDPALSASTDDEGRFVLRAPHVEPTPGRSFDDFEDFPRLVVDAEGFAVRGLRCAGLLSGDYDAGTIAIEPGGTLVGRTVDEHGQPVAGARLSAQQGRCEPRYVATEDDWEVYSDLPVTSDISGEDGRFELGAFWPGSAVIRITADGFLFSFHESVPIEVGARRDMGDVVLPSGTTLQGVVVDAADAPVPDAVVYFQNAYAQSSPVGHDTVLCFISWLHKSQQPQARTDAEGRFTLEGLEPSNYSLFVDAPGFEPLQVNDVAAGPAELRLSLVRQASLLLTVLDEETGEPIEGASVEAVRRSSDESWVGDPRLPVRAGTARGEFIVERLGTWRTDLLVSAPGYASIGQSVEAAKPPESVRRTVPLAREARVTGRVLAASGQPLTGATVATVTLKDAPVEPPTHSATSDEVGAYQLSGLAPGEWLLRASAEGFADVERTAAVRAAATLADIDFQLEPVATIFGTCFGSDGRPSPGHLVRLARVTDGELGGWLEVASNVQGDYRAPNLKPGRWAVMDEQQVEVDLVAGQELRVDVHQIKRTVIRGHVFADGKPKTGVLVMALDRDPEREKLIGFAIARWTTRADAEGAYELEVGAGEWSMQAGGIDPPCGGSVVVPVTVGWGEQHVVDLVFSGERVDCLVVDASSGEPVPGAVVSLKRVSESDPLTPILGLGSSGNRMEFWPRSDTDGRVELPYVLPGTYRVRCEGEGYVSPKLPELVVRAGQPVDLRIELAVEAVLRGSAKLASGAPVKEFTYITLQRVGATEQEPLEMTPTDNGRFKFGGLAAGDYLVAIWPKYPPHPGAPPAEPPLVELPVSLKAGESKSVELIVPVSP